MLEVRSAGLIVTTEPEIETAELVTSMVCTVESSLDFLMRMFPAPLATDSLKVSTRLLVTETPVPPFAGDMLMTVGGVVSVPAIV